MLVTVLGLALAPAAMEMDVQTRMWIVYPRVSILYGCGHPVVSMDDDFDPFLVLSHRPQFRLVAHHKEPMLLDAWLSR